MRAVSLWLAALAALAPLPARAGAQPTVTIGDATVSEGNSGTLEAILRVELSEPVGVPVTANFATAAIFPATGGVGSCGTEDFVVKTGTVSIPVGSTRRSVRVAVCGDAVGEPDDVLEVHLTDLTGPDGIAFARSVGTITIVNDDGAIPEPELPVPSLTNAATDEGGSLLFTIQLSHAADVPVTVAWRYDPISAGRGTTVCGGINIDFLGSTAPTEATFAPGETVKGFSVPTCDDSEVEGEQIFVVPINRIAPTIQSENIAQATATIRDNHPKIRIGDATARESAGHVDLPITLSKPAPYFIAVPAAVRPAARLGARAGSACGPGVDFVAPTEPSAIPIGRTESLVRVTLCDDSVREVTKRGTIVLSQPGGAEIEDGQATFTIQDDD